MYRVPEWLRPIRPGALWGRIRTGPELAVSMTLILRFTEILSLCLVCSTRPIGIIWNRTSGFLGQIEGSLVYLPQRDIGFSICLALPGHRTIAVCNSRNTALCATPVQGIGPERVPCP